MKKKFKNIFSKIWNTENISIKNGLINFFFVKGIFLFYTIKFLLFFAFVFLIFRGIAFFFTFLNKYIFYKPITNLPYFISGLVVSLVILSLWDVIVKYFKKK